MQLSSAEFLEICERFKLGTNPAINVLNCQPQLVYFCSVFHLFPPKFSPIEYDTLPEEQLDLWHWLWGNVEMNFELMATALDVSEEQLERFYKRLILLKLIFPDGSVFPEVTSLLLNMSAETIRNDSEEGKKK